MQVLVKLGESLETYIREKLHTAVKAPVCCPNCQSSRKLRALGYYERGIASTGKPAYLRFFVRRFRCANCQRTTSVLPDFSQPYRLISNEIIGCHFRGELATVPDQWSFLLNRYWNRFTDWLPILASKVEEDFRLKIATEASESSWISIAEALGEIGSATRKLTEKSGITLFGAYLCHQPHRSNQRILSIHTTVLLRTGKDPPN